MKKVFVVVLAAVMSMQSIGAKKPALGGAQLIQAAANGNLEKVKELLDQGVDIETKGVSRYSYGSPLHHAAANGKIEVVKLLLEREANINSRNWKRNTPLHDAALNKHKDMVILLIEKGADVNTRNNIGLTPAGMPTTKEIRQIIGDAQKKTRQQ